MSMTTLKLLGDYYGEMDRANDEYESAQAAKRAVVLPPEEIENRAHKLLEKIKLLIWKYAKNGTSAVPLNTEPTSVVQCVVAILAKKGIQAMHQYNEVDPQYDFLRIDLKNLEVVL